MRSVPLAMTWDMLRRGRWTLIGAALGANALPVLLFSVLKYDGALEPGDNISMMLHTLLVEINLLMFGAAVFGVLGSPARLYAFPIRTSSLVLVQMVEAMVAVSAELALSTALLNAAFGLRWPLCGPALFAAAVFATILGVTRLFEKSVWVIFAMTVTMAGLGLWLKSRGGAVLGPASRLWTEVTPADLLTLVLTTAFAYEIAVVGVARNRRGDPPISIGFITWFTRVFAATPRAGRPFRTPAQAQLWFEWQKKGLAIPATAVFGLAVGFVIWLFVSRDAKDLYQGLVAGGALLSFLGLLNGFLLGKVDGRVPDLQIAQFQATRPVTSTEMARTILKCGVIGLVIAWAIWAASFLALAETLRALEVKFPLRLPAPLGWWFWPATLLGAWAATSFSTPLVLAGRKGLFGTIVIGSIVLFICLLLFSKFALTRDGQEQFLSGALLVAGTMLGLGTVWAFFAARRRSLIGTPTVLVAASVWGLLCAIVALYAMSHPAEGVTVYVLAAGILALAISPLATAPLALAWNRNR